MQIKEIMTHTVETISADSSVKEAAEKMKNLDVGFLPVIDGDQLVGVITDRDITIRLVALGLDPKTTRVRDEMTTAVIYCFEDQDITEAAKIMEDNQIRRLLVLNHNRQPVGVFSVGDLAIHGVSEVLCDVLRQVSEPAHVHR